jgi:hypothetical protein
LCAAQVDQALEQRDAGEGKQQQDAGVAPHFAPFAASAGNANGASTSVATTSARNSA